MMGVVNLQYEIGDRELQLVHPEPARFRFRREAMAGSEIEQDVGGVADHELAGFQERRCKGRRPALRLHHLQHCVDAARPARDVDIRGARFFQRQPHEFTATLDFGPVIELIGHRRVPLAGGGTPPT